MGSVSRQEQQARARARQRREALDADRGVRDERIEVAVAGVLVAQEARAEARAKVQAAEVLMGDALRSVLGEGVKVADAAALCELDQREVLRLRRCADDADSADATGPVAHDAEQRSAVDGSSHSRTEAELP